MLKWAVAKDERRKGNTGSKGCRKRRLKLSLSNLNAANDEELIIRSAPTPRPLNTSPTASPTNISSPKYPKKHSSSSNRSNNNKSLQKSCSFYFNGWKGGNKKNTCTANYDQAPYNTNNQFCAADSKSLLYMSLDHLPLAIVKQYERMLQDAAQIQRDCIQSPPTPKKPNKGLNRCKSHTERISTDFDADTAQKLPGEGVGVVNGSSVREAINRPLLRNSNRLIKPLPKKQCDKVAHHFANQNVNNEEEARVASKNQCNTLGYTHAPLFEGVEPRILIPNNEHGHSPILPIEKIDKAVNTSIICDSTEENAIQAPDEEGGNFKTVQNNISKVNNPHDTTDPQFLEKSVVFSTPAVSRRAKKFTLKRSELRKLERLRNQTERLNRYLKKHYHECLPNLTEEEEEQCSPEEKSLSASVLRTHWVEETSGSSPDSDSSQLSHTIRPRTIILPQSSPVSSVTSDPDRCIRWQNIRNSALLLTDSSSESLLPIIPEDSEHSSSTTGEENKCECLLGEEQQEEEVGRRDYHSDSFNTSPNAIQTFEHSFNFHNNNVNKHVFNFVGDSEVGDPVQQPLLLLLSPCEGVDGSILLDSDEAHGADRKLKGLSAEPLGDSFDVPPCVRKVQQEFTEPPTTTISSAQDLKARMLCSDQEDDSVHGARKRTIRLESEDWAHYYSSENETWNSHEYPSRSPCDSSFESSFALRDSRTEQDRCERISSCPSTETTNVHTAHVPLPKEKDDEDEEREIVGECEESRNQDAESCCEWTPNDKMTKAKKKCTTPKTLARKPPVKTTFSGKGEVLIHIYRNGDYVTLHVVQAKNLQPSYRSSWKLAIKISVLPEAEATFTRCETVTVAASRSWVKIDQKFSFEIPSSAVAQSNRKVFLTFVKRLEKRTSFLGWTTLDLQVNKSAQCWLKLRKRKMSCGAYPAPQSYQQKAPTMSNGGFGPHHQPQKKTKTLPPAAQEMDNRSEDSHQRIVVSPESETDSELPPIKSQLQNSSTMDSGVEDCCEPQVAPYIEFDETAGHRVHVKMLKPQDAGFGFSVVWVSPPRIERLEKDKVADLAGLRIGDLIIGVNGEDVTIASNATIYQKMKSTMGQLELEVWRKYSNSVGGGEGSPSPPPCTSSPRMASVVMSMTAAAAALAAQKAANQNASLGHGTPAATPRFHPQPPPVSILKPPPPAPPVRIGVTPPPNAQPNNSSWRIRFNVELLDNEDDSLRQFFIQELKFFRKVVSALDRYLIPAQANRLLTPHEIHLIFANIITIITMTKRILQCVANGAAGARLNLGKILHSTHSDHLCELKSAYTSYGTNLGSSAMILSEKMTLQAFARFVLETPVPKGHLDMTSLLFAPFEHLRNLCEISEEIAHNHESWTVIATQLKECYAEIVVQTDFMEPISHISMKKNPLLSVRDLEKRIVSTNCQQALKVSEKGRKWLFGSRLFRRETDGSWSPVWAFLFSDCIVLTSHTTRDRVFFVKEPPIRLEDVVTLHFNLPRKNENEFRLLFGPEPPPNRLDKILPMYRNKKSNQVILRTTNVQLKSMWKLLLQRQIITLNTRLSKSSSSNFSISEFCEKFPISPPQVATKDELTCCQRLTENDRNGMPQHQTLTVCQQKNNLNRSPALTPRANLLSKLEPSRILENESPSSAAVSQQKQQSEQQPIKVVGGGATKPMNQPGISNIAKELLKNRMMMMQIPENVPLGSSSPPSTTRQLPPSNSVSVTRTPAGTSTADMNNFCENCPGNASGSVSATSSSPPPSAPSKTVTMKGTPSKLEGKETPSPQHKRFLPHASTADSECAPAAKGVTFPILGQNSGSLATIPENCPSRSLNNNNNNNIQDFNDKKDYDTDKCLCKTLPADRVPGQRSPIITAAVTKQKSHVADSNKLTVDGKSSLSESSAHTVSIESNLSKLSVNTNSCNNTPHKSPLTVAPVKPAIKSSAAAVAVTAIVEIPSKTMDKPTDGKNESSSATADIPRKSPNTNNITVVTAAASQIPTNNKPTKPGCKIITNATLKSRQQEVLTSRIIQTEKSSDTIITDKSDAMTYKSDSTQYQSIRRGTDTIQNFMESSTSPCSFRCHSENEQTTTTGKVKSIKDSPIVSGFGSEKSRRRLLFDYKIKRDYPELFGITPKDRRSFIKKLAYDMDNEKTLVTPYYYRTYSPVAIPKQEKNLELLNNKPMMSSSHVVNTIVSSANIETVKPIELTSSSFVAKKESVLVTNGKIPSESAVTQSKKDVPTESATTTPAAIVTAPQISNKIIPMLEQENNKPKTIIENEYGRENEVIEGLKNLKDNNNKEDLSLAEDMEDDSEAESGTQDQENQTNSKTNRRSPEESSNDSGISEEITDKSKCVTTATDDSLDGSFLPPTNRSDCDSVVSMSMSSCVNSVVSTTSTSDVIYSVSANNTQKIIEEEELELDRSNHLSRNSSEELPEAEVDDEDRGKKDKHAQTGEHTPPKKEEHHVTISEPAVTAVIKVDKSIGTDDDLEFVWASHLPERTFRNVMAERREAFFHNNQMSITSSSGASTGGAPPPLEPLIVKVLEGCTVHSTQPEPSPKPPYERVLLTRFEKETTARVERVESSDDSTSSDAASASPALENGTTDPSWSSSSSSLAGYSSFKEDTSSSHPAVACPLVNQASTSSSAYGQLLYSSTTCSTATPSAATMTNGHANNNIHVMNGSVHNYYQISRGPEIVVTQESPDTPSGSKNDYSSDGEVDSIVLNGKDSLSNESDENGRSSHQELLRVESNDSTAENYGDDDDDDYNFDDDEEEDLSHCSVATINRYGTYESLEKIESEDSVGVLPEFPRTAMPRSKARFTFEDDDDDDEDLFEEDFESDFNFRFPTQIQDNTYSVSRLGPLPPLLEEDFEDEMYDEQRANGGSSPSCSHHESSINGGTLRSRHETGLRRDNSFLLARLATMYARSSISPLKILRELWLKKRISQSHPPPHCENENEMT